MARSDPPRIVAGDMVDDLPAVADDIAANCVVTSWSFGYLDQPGRQRFVEQLQTLSHVRPVAWISAEGVGVVDLLPSRPAVVDGPVSVLGLVLFDRGEAEAIALGLVHSHGAWIDWAGESGTVASSSTVRSRDTTG